MALSIPNLQMSRRLSRIHAYVLSVAAAAAAATAISALPGIRGAYPGAWGPFVLTVVAFLLEVTSTALRSGSAAGSISFVIHLAALVLFGPFWALGIVLVSTLLSQLALRRPITRVVFNPSQRVLSLSLAAIAYNLLGGTVPLGFIAANPVVSPEFSSALRDLGAFFAAVLAYFAANSMLVSGAVAISEDRSFREVWKTNTLWVLGYDIAASMLAILVAWLFEVFSSEQGLTRFAFPAIFLPIIAIKHVYGKLNTLQGLYDELDDAYERLELNMREQLNMMVKSIEARDPYTSGHSRRVSRISRAIATDFGLAPELIAEVENAALLHDVGKIHAEFAPLLQKEGKLTAEEWEIMKTHSVRSAELVALFSRFEGHVQQSVRSHHERWDGLGYPDGVGGKQIPLGARIIMIADTVDAMTTDRPYRKALGFDVVVSELVKHRGTQFDPDLVDCAVNSVSLRRLVSSPDGIESEQSMGVLPQGTVPRSHRSFLLGRRAGGAPQPAS